MSIARLLNKLGNTVVTMTRFNPGQIIGGKLEASRKNPVNFLAAVQPVNGREREHLPEGWRQKYIVKFYSEERLLVSDTNAAQRADLLEIRGEYFEVISVEEQVGLSLSHFKVFAARRND